jgi:hypothetical protein
MTDARNNGEKSDDPHRTQRQPSSGRATNLPSPPASSSPLDVALAYAAAGFAVVSLIPGTKKPRCELNKEGTKFVWVPPTRDTEKLRRQFGYHPTDGIAIIVGGGYSPGIAVMDIDGDKGGDDSAAQIKARFGPPRDTAFSLTGSPTGRHVHVYYRYDLSRQLRSYKGLGPGIEFMGGGGRRVLVEYPTRHPDPPHKLYEWARNHAPWEIEIAPLPEWMYRPPDAEPPPACSNGDGKAEAREHAYCHRALENAERELGEVVEGGRNNTLNEKALKLASYFHYRAYTKEECCDALMRACIENGLWSDDGKDQCLATFDSGWTAGLRAPKSIEWPDPASVFERITEDLGAKSPDPLDPYAEQKRKTRSIVDDIEAAFNVVLSTKPDYLIFDLIDLRTLTFMVADPAAGKTALACHLAARVSAGTDFFKRKTKRVPVLYVAAEAQRSIRRRIAALKESGEIPERQPFYYLPRAININDVDDHAAVVAALEELRADSGCDDVLLIIDTIPASTPGYSENDAEGVSRTMAALQHFVAIGATVIGIVHFGKDKTKGIAGHHRQLAGADTVIELTVDAAKQRHISLRKAREGDPTISKTPFTLRVVELGKDDEGNLRRSVVVDATAGVFTVVDEGSDFRDRLAAFIRSRTKGTRNCRDWNLVATPMLHALYETAKHSVAVEGSGYDPRVVLNANHQPVPNGQLVVKLDDWRAACERLGLFETTRAGHQKFGRWAFRLAQFAIRMEVGRDKTTSFAWPQKVGDDVN